jgi:hypothetical protein
MLDHEGFQPPPRVIITNRTTANTYIARVVVNCDDSEPESSFTRAPCPLLSYCRVNASAVPRQFPALPRQCPAVSRQCAAAFPQLRSSCQRYMNAVKGWRVSARGRPMTDLNTAVCLPWARFVHSAKSGSHEAVS